MISRVTHQIVDFTDAVERHIHIKLSDQDSGGHPRVTTHASPPLLPFPAKTVKRRRWLAGHSSIHCMIRYTASRPASSIMFAPEIPSSRLFASRFIAAASSRRISVTDTIFIVVSWEGCAPARPEVVVSENKKRRPARPVCVSSQSTINGSLIPLQRQAVRRLRH